MALIKLLLFSATLVSIGLGTIYGRHHSLFTDEDALFSLDLCGDVTPIVSFGTSFTVAIIGAVTNLLSAIIFIMISLCHRTMSSHMSQAHRGGKMVTKMSARVPPMDYNLSSMVVYNPSHSPSKMATPDVSKKYSGSVLRDSTTLDVLSLGDTGGSGASTSHS